MIESIKIKVGDKTIELTLEEAIQLKIELQDLFDRGLPETFTTINPDWPVVNPGSKSWIDNVIKL